MCWAESGGGVPTCHTGPLPLTTRVIQSADTFVSDIVILSTRWTAASHQSCGRVWTEDLHLVLTLVTLMHAARRCITPVTWTRPPVTFTVPSIRNRWRLRAVLSISRPSPAGGGEGAGEEGAGEEGGDSFIRSPAPPRPEPRSKHEDRSLARMQQTIPLIVASCSTIARARRVAS